MIEINWKKDYNQDFICPFCGQVPLVLSGKSSNGTQRFKCSNCHKKISSSNLLDFTIDPRKNIVWHRRRKIENFVCPNENCQAENMCFRGLSHGKAQFKCRECGKLTFDVVELNASNVARYADSTIPVTSSASEDDSWDLRTILSDFDDYDRRFTLNFENVKCDWFKKLVKQFILSRCKTLKSFSTINKNLTSLRIFSEYLETHNINHIEEINREVMIDFLLYDKTGVEGRIDRLVSLRSFFKTGNLKGWFSVDPHIIRDEDYPKRRKKNPDPLSDTVREQIEAHLGILPEPLVRMWIICFFTAMRLNELALLQKDCLVQEGSQWKVVWSRRKGENQHEVPITRNIAKVIQEQQEYIEQLWGKNWKYLFCHYHNVSQDDPSHPKLNPVKRAIPQQKNPLALAICCLIDAFQIKDDNGKIAKFSTRLIRPTRLTQLFEQGHDLAVISAWAGHKHLTTTSTHYTHVSCHQIENNIGHIQKALLNSEGKPLNYESLPKSFWEKPVAHQIELSGDHINTPIYGYCGLPLTERCDKFRACYTCRCFVAFPEKLPQYLKVRDELRAKEANALVIGDDISLDQFKQQADQLDKIIASLQEVV